MRPDIEDYEELNNAADLPPRSRAMSWLVLVVAVGGFAALAYYAYHSGTKNPDGSDVMVVQADSGAIKQVPTDPEGEQFANKDKTIYDVITPGAQKESDKVEKLMPEPEQPVAVRDVHDTRDDEDAMPETAETKAPTTTTYVNKNLEKPVDPVDAQAAKQAAVKAEPVATAAPTAKPTETVGASNAAKPVATASATAPVGTPTFVNESTVAGKKADDKPAVAAKPMTKPAAKAPVKEVAKPAAKAAATPASSGGATIQLGAFKSEEDAQTTWKKIQGKFSSTLTGSHSVVKADLPNGTFYRLRANVASAKDTCAKLSAAGQACMPVK